jgi:hypothetical protein
VAEPLPICLCVYVVRNVGFDIMNRTIPDESGRVHGWISEPSGRGTASLLYTCLITIFLCAWSAMHTPIPARHTSWMENFFYKAGFAAFAIIAPEIVFLEAIRSYFFVRETLDELSASLLEVRMIYLPSCFLLSMTLY